jgi:long-chain acyl-CoA synthetase
MGATFLAVKGLFRGYFNLSLHNEERLPRQGPYILAANHSSHLDTAAIISALAATLGTKGAQRMHVVGARDYFFDSSLKRWFFSTCLNVVPIDREEVSLAGLRMVRAILESGESVLIFPEGTRTRTGQLQPFKPGIGLIAWEVGVPIVPVYIGGTRVAWPAGQGLPRRAKVSVVFGNPVSMQDYAVNGKVSTDDLYRQIALDVRNAVEELSRGQGSG